MRKTIAATLAALALSIGAATLATPATAAAPSAGPIAVRPCQVLRTLPAYTYRYQGATASEPTGAARYREAASETSGATLQRACRAMVTQQRQYKGAPVATLTVLREWGF